MQARLTELNENEILLYLGYRGQEYPAELEEQIKSCVEKVVSASAPRLIWRRLSVESPYFSALSLEGKDIGELLEGCREAVLMAVTLGPDVDRLLKRSSISNMADAVIMDACASTAIENVADNFEMDLRKEVEAEGLYLTDRFSPGYGDLPLSAQKQLCAALDTGRKIGLTLSPSMLMIPGKSVTAVLGISERLKPLRKEDARTVVCSAVVCTVKKGRAVMKNKVILDGGMGTMLQAAGLGLGERPEIFGMEHPDVVEQVQRSYVEAGSQVLYANTFGANAHKLEGTGHTVAEVVSANVAIARKAASGKAKVALDVGPIGELLEPLGMLSFEKAYEIYAEVVKAGAACGVDFIIFETMTDLYEVKAAVLAAKENSALPVWVTMSFEASGRTFTGTTIAAMALTLTGLSVDALGINCSLGPKELVPLVKELRQWTDLPVIVKPNAGLPDPATGDYSMGAEQFGRYMMEFPKFGASIFGGCCGTNPDFIRALSVLPEVEESGKKELRRGVCSAGQVAEFGGLRVIGERINPTGKKRFQQALRENDMNYIMERAIEQADAGADILDINVGLPGIDEPEMMTRVVKAVQSVVSLPLQIDSSDAEAIEAGLRACNGRAIVNSVNGEQEVLEKVLPIVKKYGAAVVGLTMDKGGIPETAGERIAIAKRILQAAESYGIPREDVMIDCLTLTISAQQKQAVETLKAVRYVHEEMGLHCVLGVSNISFGLPERIHITSGFLMQAMCCGLDFPIINPNQKEIMDTVFSYRALSGEDADCAAYIERFANAAPEKAAPASSPAQMDIETAVIKGLKQEVASLTEKYLETMSELDVINQKLIPALDIVGERYEKQQIFLPQLINAANAACAGFDLIKTRIAGRGGESLSKGKIVMATVEGDIHDIGKNIVRVVLENYGYQVIDLGRDVPVESVVEAVLKEDVSLVGLSALMTTTVSSMQKTIAALRKSGHLCKVFVGGAVLTESYAMEIGADYYAKDAKASVDIAKEVLG